MEDISQEEIQEWRERLVKMSAAQLFELYRHAKPGHIVFRRDLPLHLVYKDQVLRKAVVLPEK